MTTPTSVRSLAEKRSEPDAEVIEILEEWLALARTGELRDVVVMGKVLYVGDDEFCWRYGDVCRSQMEAVGMLEQKVFDIRYDMQSRMTPVDRVKPADEPEED